MLNLFFIGKFLTHIFFLKFKEKLILLGNAHSVSFKKYWPQKRILNSFNILLLTKKVGAPNIPLLKEARLRKIAVVGGCLQERS